MDCGFAVSSGLGGNVSFIVVPFGGRLMKRQAQPATWEEIPKLADVGVVAHGRIVSRGHRRWFLQSSLLHSL
jgi:hypothetical protein